MTTPVWSTACIDWERRIVAGEGLIAFEPLFPSEADAALEVFKSLRIYDLPRQPTFGEVCEPWVFDFVRAIFGAYDHGQAKRLIREFLLLISKKNTKSTIAAGIMVTALVRNWRHGAELLILAPTIEIANNSFVPAAAMVRLHPKLRELLHVQDNYRQITHLTTDAVLKVVAADTDVVGGKKAAFVLVDELWIFGKRANASAMLQEALGGLVSRPEGFVIFLTTQSDAPPTGVFKEKLDYFRDVRDGKIVDPTSLGVLYEFPAAIIAAKAYLDPSNWRITNPNLDKSVSTEWLLSELIKAQRGNEDALRTFLAKHLNVEIGMNLRANRWPGATHWQKRGDQKITLRYLFKVCDVIVPGIDGGGLDDLFGLSLLGRHKITKDWLLWVHAWCHRGVLDLRQSIAPRLLQFEKEGDLTIVDDELEDISKIVRIIKLVKKKRLLGGVSVDPAGLGEFVDALADKEIDITVENKLLIGAPQGFGMMNSIKTCERKLVKGTLRHAPSPMMDWCVSNLKIEPTATAIRATKQTAGDAKIDPAIAMFNSAYLMATNPKAHGHAKPRAMVL
ncbi:phage terminase large subunit-like protein [Bradyrhizobium sp. USDA 4011]|uniref:Phage terminase-like protein, large subunit, contains N-terminal HTH domain n=1 Tax=Bradyrhizobium erythrophlei TaxID=1437360 RepID=A0A1H4NU29_9BRAD|nr:terminase large subunit [Bradyrhizobium erythrophlei]SEB98684.1 Phage terminase-like protein, large subunit, contains N-terminal HTH domain [Bradyrhizobium erythrophlei]